jgi:ribonuclease HI
VKKKKCMSKLPRTAGTEELYKLIERAENWLKNNEYEQPVLKWDTRVWGEIPADFGRK